MSSRAQIIFVGILLYILSILTTYYLTEDRAYRDGYNSAIKNAVLQSVSNDGYTLSFEGELHQYSY